MSYFTTCKVCGTVLPMNFNYYSQGAFGLCPLHSLPTFKEHLIEETRAMAEKTATQKMQEVALTATELAKPRCTETTKTFEISEEDIHAMLKEIEEQDKAELRKDTLVVNLFAGPGCGKSSVAAGVFHDLKWKGIECEMALEFAKDLVWEKRHETFEDQIYLFGKQHHRIFRLLGQVQVVITDCPILLSPIYDKEKRQTFKQLVLEEHNKMWTYNVMLRRMKPYNPNGRIHNEDEAKNVDRDIVDLLTECGVCFEVFGGTPLGKDDIVKKIVMLLKWRQNPTTTPCI